MKLGSLCSGAGALDMAVEQVFGAETVWHCEIDDAASKVLAAWWPGVPNHRDLINTDWSRVEPVDIMCFGWPCQPFSLAGKRKGHEDERAIWPHIANAVRALRPRVCVMENVAAVIGSGEFGRVADSMASLGYDLRWICLRASDVGAAHRRERLFIVATDTASRGTDADQQPRRLREPVEVHAVADAAVGGDGPLLPTPAVNDIGEGKTVEWWDEWTAKSKVKHGNGSGHGNSLAIEAQRMAGAGPVELLPTPCAQQSGNTPENHLAKKPGRKVVTDLAILVENGLIATGGELLPTTTSRDHKGHNQRDDDTCLPGALLPTPAAPDGIGGGPNNPDNRLAPGHHVQLLDLGMASDEQWGKYAPVIARWERIAGPAPSPTEPNRNGNPRLNPAFSEWMMGWPAGWVTDVEGLSRNDKLRIIGNGVVPQQAAAALSWLLSLNVSEVAA